MAAVQQESLQLLARSVSEMKGRQNQLKIAKMQIDAQKAQNRYDQSLADQQSSEYEQLLQMIFSGAGGGATGTGAGVGAIGSQSNAGGPAVPR